MAKKAKRVKISVAPGLNPSWDSTDNSTLQWTDASMVRWKDKKLKLVPGWEVISLPDNLVGYPDSGITWVYTYYDFAHSRTVTLVGTTSRLYAGYDIDLDSNYGNDLDVFSNITPVLTSTTTIADSLDTYYNTLANNPITTVINTKNITFAQTSTKIRVGDSVTISGAATTNGIPDTEINATHTVTAQATNSFTVAVPTTNATSSGTGGGASVVVATAIVTVAAAAHGLSDGDRVKIASAATTGGIPDTEINAEHIIRSKTAGAFDIVVTTKATSSVSAGGGASTTYQKPITVDNGGDSPLWSGDLFGDVVILTPGNGGDLYEWDGDFAEAPVVVTNSPGAVDFCFVTDNIIVAVYGRTRSWCDQGNRTDWTAGAADVAGEDDDEGADPYIGYAHARGETLLFTKTQVWKMTFIGSPYVFAMECIYRADGICGRKAAREYQGVIYWMGHKDFYRYYGGQVEVIPGNTLKEYVFSGDDIDWVFYNDYRKFTVADVRQRHGEIWWYPFGIGNVSDKAIVYSIIEGWWAKHDDCFISAAGEGRSTPYELNGDPSGILWAAEHDNSGLYNPGGEDYFFFIESNFAKIGNGDETFIINRVIPDVGSGLTIDNFEIRTKLQPHSAIRTFQYTAITDADETIDTRAHGRYRQVYFDGDAYATQDVNLWGDWHEEIIRLSSR